MKTAAIAIPREALTALSGLCQFKNESLIRLLMYSMGTIDTNNEVRLEIKKVKEDIKVSESTIRRSIKKLVLRRLLIPTNKKDVYVFGNEFAMAHRVEVEIENEKT